MSFLMAPIVRTALIPSLILSFLTTGIAGARQAQTQSIAAISAPVMAPPVVPFKTNGSGTMNALDTKGKKIGQCPLQHTDVKAAISGYVARVTVKQVFENPYKNRIEAIYTFPLSDTGAVDDMVMKIGTREIKGTIKKREEARQIYEAARQNGQTASLLDQERSNIFTQQVANIDPGEKIEVTLQYVDLLPYDGGKYTFAFPTVVGPRFNPPNVTDAANISPPIAAPGTRSGHDISINVSIDSGVPMSNVESKLHEVSVKASGEHADIALADKATIPNKDFVLSWQVAADKLQSGYLTHKNGTNGFFTLMVMPPKKVTTANVAPKEMIFLIDCSGSQSGPPLQKAKETLSYIVEHMNPNDTFQIISFSDHLTQFADKPQPVSDAMRRKAQTFIAKLEANGGTWMAPAVEKACSMPVDDHRLRIVTFMTDGYVGNDYEILGMIRKFRGTSRWFSFGTGNSVNRLLIDGMAKEGGGEADYVLLNSSAQEVGRKFYDRISSPVLTDVKLDFDGVNVKEVLPKVVSDVWAQKPLYFTGRYETPGKGSVTVSGFSAGKPYSEKINITLPATNLQNPALGSIWARAKVDRLLSEDYFGAQNGQVNKELKEEIIKTALDYHIMTEYTSFVAVDSKKKSGGPGEPVPVPVELPDGVNYEAVVGKPSPMRMMSTQAKGGHFYAASGGGGGGGYGGMLRARVAPQLAASPAPSPMAPPPPPAGHTVDEFKGSAFSRNELMASEPASGDKKNKSDAPTQGVKEESVKLDPVLQSIIASPKAPLPKWLDIKNGKLLVEIWMNDVSEQTLKTLKQLGFELTFKADADKHLMGRIAINKLSALAKLPQVRLVEPPRMH